MGITAPRLTRLALAVAGVAGALLAVASPALAAPAVTIDPATVTTSGQLITVRVTGCAPGEAITVTSTAESRPPTTVNADGYGNATTSVGSGGSAGTFSVSAACSGATATGRFTVVARTPSADDAGVRLGVDLKVVGAGGGIVAALLLTAVVLLALRRRAVAT